MAERRIISTSAAPKAIGPYCQAMLVGETLYMSGQIGIDPATGKIVDESVGGQTRQIFENIKAILAEAQMGPGDIVQCQVFLADMGDFAEMNEVYAEFFAGDYPTRAAIEAGELPAGAKVEILATAVSS